jgi:transposase
MLALVNFEDFFWVTPRRLLPILPLVGIELNPGPGSGKHLSELDRWRIVIYTLDFKMKGKTIASKLKIQQNAVTEVLKKYEETGTVHDRPGRGAKRKLSAEETKEVIKKAKRGETAPQISRECETEVDPRTIQRTLKREGFAYLNVVEKEHLTQTQIERRLEYAEEMKDYDWKRVLCSDEKSFWLGSGVQKQWQKPGKRKSREVRKHPRKLHVWGAIGYYAKAKLFYFEENLTKELYQQILTSRLKDNALTFSSDAPKSLTRKWVFLQDNDPKHTAKKSKETIEKLVGDRFLSHPSNSPDLNPMEDIWSYLDRKVKERNVTTINGLKRILTQEWNSMDWAEIRSSVESMPDRINECIELKGKRTHY